MWQELPVYDRLVAERGDIPTQVRTEAEKVLQNLEEVMRSTTRATGEAARSAKPLSPSHQVGLDSWATASGRELGNHA
ncbi:hypothetical protein AB0D04_04620 [Streptomyces sp. NPDC048483]|uniref:hypothetical protein n=1 Tax=Streptomyces sp. NPDC048483 TaxID=3154927 RepID=UPI00341D3CE7